MKIFVILAVACVTALAAPEGYTYKEPAAVIQHGNLNGFQPVSGNGLPCSHASHQTGNTAVIQAQSAGRILNHQHYSTDPNLVTAASGTPTQSQAVTVNSQIVVGESASGISGISGGSQEYQTGQGYVQGQFSGHTSAKVPFQQPFPQPEFQQLPQPPTHFPAQPFHLGNFAPGRSVPPQVVSGQTQGYSYNQGGAASQISQHVHHHYLAPGPGAIINGVGKVPPPPLHILNKQTQGFQYASGYGGNKFSSSQTDHIGTYNGATDISSNAPYRPQGIIPNSPVNFADNRPLQQVDAGYAGNYQHGLNLYTGPFNQNSFSKAGSFGVSGSGSLNGITGSQFGSTLNEHLPIGSDIGLFNSVSTSGSALDGQLGHVIRETFASAPLDPTIEKHIYVHVPPEDLEDNAAKHTTLLPQQSPKKHYKIIFIKAPSAPQPNYAQLASAASQQIEEKTLVYVLVKKPDEPSFEEILQTVQKPSKPEVYFIKYKTRKENEANLPAFATNSGTSSSGSEQYNTGNTFSGFEGYNSVSGSGESNEEIDIRAGGDTSSISSSNTYSTSSNSLSSSDLNVGVSSGKKHELYGVPLE